MERIRALINRLPFQEWRIIRYIISGGTSAVVNLSLLYLFTSILHVWYIYSAIIATSVALIVSFALQKLFTFRNFATERVHVQFPMHATLALSNIVFNAGLLFVFVEWLHLWYMGAQIVAGAFLACVNYTVYKTFIFTEHE